MLIFLRHWLLAARLRGAKLHQYLGTYPYDTCMLHRVISLLNVLALKHLQQVPLTIQRVTLCTIAVNKSKYNLYKQLFKFSRLLIKIAW